jgi:hypothetical protein
MAQMMGNGSAKDNFFLKTRTALQDTLTLFFITRNISFNNNIEFYLPRLVEMVSDLIEVESNQDNKSEKFKFLAQDALVIVSNKGLNSELTSETGVYIFAKRVLEINSSISLDECSKKVEQKATKLEVEKQSLVERDEKNLGSNLEKIKTKIFVLEDELKFEKKVLSILKESKS